MTKPEHRAVAGDALGVKGSAGELGQTKDQLGAFDLEGPLQVLVLEDDAQTADVHAAGPDRPGASKLGVDGVRGCEEFGEPAAREDAK